MIKQLNLCTVKAQTHDIYSFSNDLRKMIFKTEIFKIYTKVTAYKAAIYDFRLEKLFLRFMVYEIKTFHYGPVLLSAPSRGDNQHV